MENNWLSVQEAEQKGVLERKEKNGNLTPDEKEKLEKLKETDKARDLAIQAACTNGNKGSGACGALIAPSQEALKKYGENVTYSLLYKDLYPKDANNLSGILRGLDAGSVTRDQAITAIAKSSGVSWETAASRYDTAMQLHGITSALAGVYGTKGVKEEVTPEVKSSAPATKPGSSSQPESKPSNGENTAHNAANYAGLKMDLKTTQAANEVVDSLRNTGKLPQNYVDKTQAMANGWKPGKALNNTPKNGQIGGDIFENSNNILPSMPGRTWREADVGLDNTMSRSNQAGTRLLYSDDGLLYITTDHYKSATSIGTWK
ncbi:DUF6862 domain-containing protein [Rouxiella sp. Mn2063]|uniref:DUF6862 domain-containing protein n=1 Tax=Rouxiella sp. Mn2063 TaxID=3395262 RepID=UPI003BBB62F2